MNDNIVLYLVRDDVIPSFTNPAIIRRTAVIENDAESAQEFVQDLFLNAHGMVVVSVKDGLIIVVPFMQDEQPPTAKSEIQPSQVLKRVLHVLEDIQRYEGIVGLNLSNLVSLVS